MLLIAMGLFKRNGVFSSQKKKKSKETNRSNSNNISNRSVSDSFSLSGKQTKQETALSLVLNFCIVVNLKIILKVTEEKKQIYIKMS